MLEWMPERGEETRRVSGGGWGTGGGTWRWEVEGSFYSVEDKREGGMKRQKELKKKKKN